MDVRRLQRWVGQRWTARSLESACTFYFTDDIGNVYVQDLPDLSARPYANVSLKDCGWKPDPNWHPLPKRILLPEGL